MNQEGPTLESLTHRLAECPAEFLLEPRIGDKGVIHVAALVSDLLCDLGGSPLTIQDAPAFMPDARNKKNALSTIFVACWLLHDTWFRNQRRLAPAVRTFLSQGLTEIAGLVPAKQFVSDPDRREEFVRLCLKTLGLRPAGETVAQAQDRLATLNSAERERVIREARAAEERAREIRAAMARRAAEEAAARYGSE